LAFIFGDARKGKNKNVEKLKSNLTMCIYVLDRRV